MTSERSLPVLNEVEIRVLGSLIEKSRTTPEYYPMTLNALTTACNQKTSRYPVVDYEEETVVVALNKLKALSLVSTAVGGTNRSVKYKHNFITVFETESDELAVLCLLFLRGPQTPGEINTNSNRLFEFESLEQVIQTINKLMNVEPAFVGELPKRPGQKETRYYHLLGESLLTEEPQLPEEPARKHVSEIEARLSSLELKIKEVKETLNKLMKELLG